MKILVPHTMPLDLTAALLPSDSVIVYAPDDLLAAGLDDADVLVVWGNSAANLADAARRLTRLRLVQTLAAGPDAALAAGFVDSAAIASGRSLHDGPVAEHALALILAAVRRLDTLHDAQRAGLWNTSVNSAQIHGDTRGQYTLDGANVVIWGFGSIAARIAPMIRMLGGHVTGVATARGSRHGFDVVGPQDAHELLATTDVLVSLLPASPEAEGLFGVSIFGALKPGAIFVNVGRGSTVDEAALEAALRSGALRAAAIDVTATEPLPAESPLWNAPNLILSPHIAGNRPQGADALVRANIEALRSGAPVTNRVR